MQRLSPSWQVLGLEAALLGAVQRGANRPTRGRGGEASGLRALGRGIAGHVRLTGRARASLLTEAEAPREKDWHRDAHYSYDAYRRSRTAQR